MYIGSKSPRRGRKHGLTLLEVLISISLTCTVMIAFAAVFPASFRMTRKTSQANQACYYASAVAEELRNRLMNKPTTDSSIAYGETAGRYLEDFCMDINNPAAKQPLSVQRMKECNFPKIEIPQPFTLVNPEATGETGILVSSGNSAGVKTFWNISVTVYWTETSPNGQLVPHSSTIVSAKSSMIMKS